MIVKKFYFKKGNSYGSKVKKLWKQDRDQGNKLVNGNKLENRKKLKMKLKVYLV